MLTSSDIRDTNHVGDAQFSAIWPRFSIEIHPRRARLPAIDRLSDELAVAARGRRLRKRAGMLPRAIRRGSQDSLPDLYGAENVRMVSVIPPS